MEGRGVARCSFLRASPHDILDQGRSGGLFLSILTPALVPTPASRAAEAKDACF